MLSQDSASSSRPSVGMELASGRRCRKLPLLMVDLAAHASEVVAVVIYMADFIFASVTWTEKSNFMSRVKF